MAHVQVPAAVRLLDRQLEGAESAPQTGKADWLNVLGLPTRGNRLRKRAGTREHGRSKRGGQNRAADGLSYPHIRDTRFAGRTLHAFLPLENGPSLDTRSSADYGCGGEVVQQHCVI